MKKTMIISTIIVSVFLAGISIYNHNNIFSPEVREETKEYMELLGDETEISKVKIKKQFSLSELENGKIVYCENENLFSMKVQFWIGDGWRDKFAEDSFSLVDIFPTSITYYRKDNPSKSSEYITYSKVRVYTDIEETKKITDWLNHPKDFYVPKKFNDATPKQKDLHEIPNLVIESKEGEKAIVQLGKRENLMVMDYGYKRIAISFIFRETIHSTTNSKRYEVISYRGVSNDMYEFLNDDRYGISPDLLWKRIDRPGMRGRK